MSDDDRLADYLARMENPNYVRTLADGCAGCGRSIVSCNSLRYLDVSPGCCEACDHD